MVAASRVETLEEIRPLYEFGPPNWMCGSSTTTMSVGPHQSLGMATPWDRFKLARNEPARPVIAAQH